MNFSEEYKSAVNIMDPSPEAMERMKKNIIAMTSQPQKKAFPFKKLAYAGSAVAACAVLTIAAVSILPSLDTKNTMTRYQCADACADSLTDTKAPAPAIIGFADVAAEENGHSDSVYAYNTDSTTATTMNADNFERDIECDGAAPDAEDSANKAEPDYIKEASGLSGGAAACDNISDDCISFSEDMSRCTIGEFEYVAISPEKLSRFVLTEDFQAECCLCDDGEMYFVNRFDDCIEILTRDNTSIGFFCLPELLSENSNDDSSLVD
ncbi:MAG: hypothetical protein ACI4KA_02425 [Oscillospiraceae bacterium]